MIRVDVLKVVWLHAVQGELIRKGCITSVLSKTTVVLKSTSHYLDKINPTALFVELTGVARVASWKCLRARLHSMEPEVSTKSITLGKGLSTSAWDAANGENRVSVRKTGSDTRDENIGLS